MELKRGKPLPYKVFLVALLLFLINLAFFMISNRSSLNKGLTGNSMRTTFFVIKNTFVQNYSTMSTGLKFFLIGQWVFILIVLVYAIYRDSRHKKVNSSDLSEVKIERLKKKNETDLDVLYEILKIKKQLPLSYLSDTFKISKDIALEWCKILESGDLIYIDYPGFGEPVIKLMEQDDANINNSNNIKEQILIKEILNKPVIKREISLEKDKNSNKIVNQGLKKKENKINRKILKKSLKGDK